MKKKAKPAILETDKQSKGAKVDTCARCAGSKFC